MTLQHYPHGNSVHVERSHIGSDSHIRMLMIGGADMTQSHGFVGETNEQHWAPVASAVKRKQFQDFHIIAGGGWGVAILRYVKTKAIRHHRDWLNWKMALLQRTSDERGQIINERSIIHTKSMCFAHAHTHTRTHSAVCLSASLKFGNHTTVLARPINNSVRSITWEENKSSGGCLKFSFSHPQLLLIGTRRETTGLWRMFSKGTVFDQALKHAATGDNCFSFSSLQLHLSSGDVWFWPYLPALKIRQKGRL